MNCLKSILIFCMTMMMASSLISCADKSSDISGDDNSSNESTLDYENATATAPDIRGEESSASATADSGVRQLPVRYQKPSYFAQQVEADAEIVQEEFEVKVGANISSTRGPQPLWDILKRLANLKGMNVSWASDVDQSVLVDVNISADDSFFAAIDNLLRQVDYFHEVNGNTIVVKYKETKQFHIKIPYMKGAYTSTVGGNFLMDREAATGTEGVVKITSSDNQFDVWQNITDNLNTLLNAWATTTVTPPAESTSTPAAAPAAGAQPPAAAAAPPAQATRRMASGQAYYTIDKSVGLITVTAPRPLLEKVDEYIAALKNELYRQVVIEAKIIEVSLKDNSSIGIDWTAVLEGFQFAGDFDHGQGGNIWPWIPGTSATDLTDATDSPTRFISKVWFDTETWTGMIKALSEQGETKVLSNPKVTVLNGQPALLSVGKDVSYIKEVTADLDTDTGVISYTVTVDSIVEGVALGVMASIVSDNSAILHLTPITTDIIGDNILYEEFGDIGMKVGVPEVGIRQVSTMVQVNNGEMLIIGGLIDNIKDTTSQGIPILSEIPILRYLFGWESKRDERRELVILLTPRIVKN